MTMASERASKRRKLTPPEEEQRAKASRGQNGPRKTKKQGFTIENTEAESKNGESQNEQEDLPSVKGLDSSDPSIRRKTLAAILSHLETRSATRPLTKTECLQTWRAFYVAVYMHDSKNAISVQNLLRDIAGTFATIAHKDDELADSSNHDSEGQQSPWLEPYHTAFHETIIREWASIDSHRMNKYLLLIRFVVQQLFKVCFVPQLSLKKEQVKAAKTEGASLGGDILTKIRLEAAQTKAVPILNTLRTVGPLNAKDPKIPNGFRLHVLDIWADELFNTLSTLEFRSEGEIEEHELAVKSVTALFREPLSKVTESNSGAQRNVRMRAKEAIEDFDDKVATLLKTITKDQSE